MELQYSTSSGLNAAAERSHGLERHIVWNLDHGSFAAPRCEANDELMTTWSPGCSFATCETTFSITWTTEVRQV